MSRTITIKEEGSTTEPVRKNEATAFDIADVLFLLAFACLGCGMAFIYWPAALILVGLIFGLCGLGISKAKKGTI
jgi:hypothetical protein